MKILGAGLARTGTASTRSALEQLGFRCFHMESLAKLRRRSARMWRDILVEGAAHRWELLLDGYDATIDLPGCLFYRELAEAFPDAKVILNVRDEQLWYESFSTLSSTSSRLSRLAQFGRRRLMSDMVDEMFERIFHRPIVRDRAIQAYLQHNAKVQEVIPADRLLVYRVNDGWRPLCEFLGVPVPKTPFPHENRRDQLAVRVRDIFTGQDHEFRQG